VSSSRAVQRLAVLWLSPLCGPRMVLLFPLGSHNVWAIFNADHFHGRSPGPHRSGPGTMSRLAGFSQPTTFPDDVRPVADYAKVAEPRTEPVGLTSLAPRSWSTSPRMVRENSPTPPWSSKVPAATVEPLSLWSMQTTRPL
jgi:hypothetical protein